jgi:hypothetical protein
MNRENLQEANKVNEKLKEFEKFLGYLEDGGTLEVHLRYKGYNPMRMTIGPEAGKVITLLVVDSIKSDIEKLKAALEAL